MWIPRGLGGSSTSHPHYIHVEWQKGEGVEKLAKMMQNGKKKQMFGTGLNLALVLLLVQS